MKRNILILLLILLLAIAGYLFWWKDYLASKSELDTNKTIDKTIDINTENSIIKDDSWDGVVEWGEEYVTQNIWNRGEVPLYNAEQTQIQSAPSAAE